MGYLDHGGYRTQCPDGIYQHAYAGGGHPGCGGYLEALEIETTKGPIFILHEYRHDGNPPRRRFRWRRFEQMDDALDKFKSASTLCRSGEGFGPWYPGPFWKSIDYNP